MEGDTHQKSDRKERDISIHSLRMEGDKNFLSMTSCNCIFQSTPSAWRETQERCQIVFPAMDFNPLPPHGGRPFPSMVVIYNGYFNPLPPHGGRLIILSNYLLLHYFNPLPPHGGRLYAKQLTCGKIAFQSTPSAWRETMYDSKVLRNHRISIHSLRMEGDTNLFCILRCVTHFNPLPPHGGRLPAQ